MDRDELDRALLASDEPEEMSSPVEERSTPVPNWPREETAELVPDPPPDPQPERTLAEATVGPAVPPEPPGEATWREGFGRVNESLGVAPKRKMAFVVPRLGASRAAGDPPARIGIAGGKGVGKSYLFQGMVYRTQVGERSGALTYFLERDSIELVSYSARSDRPRRENLEEFLRSYESWVRLETTRRDVQRWYRLRLGYRCGIFGERRAALDLELLDGSGEGFFEAPLSTENLEVWRDGFLDVEVMVFCLPLWVAFPRGDLADADFEEREQRLTGFQRVLGNFAEVRSEFGVRRPVQTLLALTMADDGRSALDTLRRRWIESYMESPRRVLRALRRSSGAARYLINARRISEAVREEFREAPEARIARLPNQLDFGAGTPWMIPLSAVDGSCLTLLQERRDEPQARLRLTPPVPVHVELPLLVALCERANALM